MDSNSNVYITGKFGDFVTFGTKTLKHTKYYIGGFAASLDTNGKWRWAVGPYCTGSCNTNNSEIVVDKSGSVVVFGKSDKNEISILPLKAASGIGNGRIKYIGPIGSSGRGGASSAVVDSEGDIVLAGVFGGSVVFGNKNLRSSGELDGFIAKMDEYGNFVERYELEVLCKMHKADQTNIDCPDGFASFVPEQTLWHLPGDLKIKADPIKENYYCTNWSVKIPSDTGLLDNGYGCEENTIKIDQDLRLEWNYHEASTVALETPIKNFHTSEGNTFVSMISQSGERYEVGNDLKYLTNLTELGLIQGYSTVLNLLNSQIKSGNTSNIDYGGIVRGYSRLADLYMLLGNEAYADAADPTIGFSTNDGQYGTEAPSIFCFQDQVNSLLEEELALLIGRDERGERPFYNRLKWNFTPGNGEAAYKVNYNITGQKVDLNGDDVPDGYDRVIDERDARVVFPQGHGDAWGHYLTAVKTYYDLLKNPGFEWKPQVETIPADRASPVKVDYLYERKFAQAAAAKARTGAEIVSLTYRKYYTEDSKGQWRGYKDEESERAWGLSEWARRAGQGAYFDWIVANAILPASDEDPGLSGTQNVNRATVMELYEIAQQFLEIQSQSDNADKGLNPLGIAKDAVPFHLSPTKFAEGKTHFEQIHDKAVDNLENAIVVFNHANNVTQMLRRQQETLEQFRRIALDREADFNNRLVEIFGMPYPEDIGPGGTYPSDYAGPDIYHFGYIELSDLMGVAPSTLTSREFTVDLKDLDIGDKGEIYERLHRVTFNLSTDGHGFVKPPSWSRRPATGEVQQALSDLMRGRLRFERALIDYDDLLKQISDQAERLKSRYSLNSDEIFILGTNKRTQTTLNDNIEASRVDQLFYRRRANNLRCEFNAAASGIPSGMFDFTAGIRMFVQMEGCDQSLEQETKADVEAGAELRHQQAKEISQLETDIQLTSKRNDFAVEQELNLLKQIVRQEALKRFDLFSELETLKQTEQGYYAAVARGQRLLKEFLRFRKQTAADIQNYRHKDMSFRIFRNDALQKYRAQFDLASKYVYLAAKAYDFETCLLDSDSRAGQTFLTEIVKARNPGVLNDGGVAFGPGLAGLLYSMKVNFDILKGNINFDNPQNEYNMFSLRKEKCRIILDENSDERWQEWLATQRVENLWDIPEFRQYCLPFAEVASGPQPGLVIRFSTVINSGQNFFGWPGSGGESNFSTTPYATKVKSIEVYFSNYDASSSGLGKTPRVYLIPAGYDMMRSPTVLGLKLGKPREWKIIEQIIPLPKLSNIIEKDLTNNPRWIPSYNGLEGELGAINRYPDFRAYHTTAPYDPNNSTQDSQLIGRSVWNSKWVLIIPGVSLLGGNPIEGLDIFIYGQKKPGTTERNGNGVSDIELFLKTYAYSGQVQIK